MQKTIQSKLEKAINNTIHNPESQELQEIILDLNESDLKKEIAKELYLNAMKLPDEGISLYTKAVLSDLSGKRENSIKFLFLYITSEIAERGIGDTFYLWDEIIDTSISKKTAEKCFNHLTNHFKEHQPATIAEYQTCLGLKYFQNDNLKALLHFKQALEHQPNHWFAYYYMAIIYVFELKNYPSAIKNLNKCISIESFNNTIGYASVFSLLGISYGECGNFPKAISLFDLSLELFPENSFVHIQKGFNQIKEKDYLGALKSFDLCIKTGFEGDAPYLYKIDSLKKLRRYDEALEVISMLEKLKGRLTKHLKEIKVQVLNLKNSKHSNNSSENKISDIEPDIAILNSKKRTKKSGQNGIIHLESVLENLLCLKLQKDSSLFNRKYVIFENEEYYGKQLPMPNVGILDLLLLEKESNNLVVLELKKDSGYNTDVVEQTLGYMNWIKQNLASPNQKVKGIICLYKASPQLLKEATCQGIEVQEYEFQFHKAN